MSLFRGLSAFPLTPLVQDRVDDTALTASVRRLVDAGVDSVTVLGSTGSYAYLDRDERARVVRLAVEHAGGVPVVVGIGALRTSHVLRHAEDAQQAGAAGVLLPAMSYQPLTPDDVHGLYEDVTAGIDMPLVVYDNPGTTHVTFSDDLYGAVARLPHVASVKIPGLPADPAAARARVQQLRDLLPAHVTVGISGDGHAAAGLTAGCDVWYSVLGGTLPRPAVALTRAALAGDHARAAALSEALAPLWALFRRHGSLRVVAAVAEQLGFATRSCLPRPIRGLDDAERAGVAVALETLR